MKCHSCGGSMQRQSSSRSERAVTEHHLCPSCGATRTSTQLSVEGEPFSLEPFDHYIAARQYESMADDGNNFRLRIKDHKP